MVHIVGIGPGNKEYMLMKAIEVLSASDMIIGFQRAVESVDFIQVPKLIAKDLKEIINFINAEDHRNISIIASGDPCFYGISDFIKKNYEGTIEIVPGISSFQYLMAKLNKSWQDSCLGSVHGREEDLLGKVKSNRVSVWLTDKTNSPGNICKRLFEQGLKVKVFVGENLSYNDEKISIGSPWELMEKEFSDLAVVVIENDIYQG